MVRSSRRATGREERRGERDPRADCARAGRAAPLRRRLSSGESGSRWANATLALRCEQRSRGQALRMRIRGGLGRGAVARRRGARRVRAFGGGSWSALPPGLNGAGPASSRDRRPGPGAPAACGRGGKLCPVVQIRPRLGRPPALLSPPSLRWFVRLLRHPCSFLSPRSRCLGQLGVCCGASARVPVNKMQYLQFFFKRD